MDLNDLENIQLFILFLVLQGLLRHRFRGLNTELNLNAIKWLRKIKIINMMKQILKIMNACDVIVKAVLTIRDNVIYTCIVLPLRTLSFCLQVQLFFLRIPINIIHLFLRRVTSSLQWPSRTQRLQSFLGCHKDDTAAVLNTMKEIRITSMNAVSKMNSFNSEFEKHRKRFDEWKRESERKTNALFVIASEEKKLMRVIVGALKHLRRLKTTRELMDQKFNNYVEGLVNLSKDAYSHSYTTNSTEENEKLKTCFNVLRQDAEQLKTVIDSKIQSNNFEVTETNMLASSPKKTQKRRNGVQDSRLLNLTMETLQSVLSLLAVENAQLKMKLNITSVRLNEVVSVLKVLSGEIVNLSQKFGEMIRLNTKIFDLQSELENAKELLRTSEVDREDMRLKLLTLQGMIKEQEDYLNFDDKDCKDEDCYVTEDDSFSSGCIQEEEFDDDSTAFAITPVPSEEFDSI